MIKQQNETLFNNRLSCIPDIINSLEVCLLLYVYWLINISAFVSCFGPVELPSLQARMACTSKRLSLRLCLTLFEQYYSHCDSLSWIVVALIQS